MISQSVKDAYYALVLPLSRVLRPIYAVHHRVRHPAIRRVHVGCGSNYMEGFVNIDGNLQQRVDYFLDVRAGLPFADSSIDFIYSCHMLEHVYLYDAIAILKDWLRVLRPDGYVRLVLPDFAYSLQIAQGKIECTFPRSFEIRPLRQLTSCFATGSTNTVTPSHR